MNYICKYSIFCLVCPNYFIRIRWCFILISFCLIPILRLLQADAEDCSSLDALASELLSSLVLSRPRILLFIEQVRYATTTHLSALWKGLKIPREGAKIPTCRSKNSHASAFLFFPVTWFMEPLTGVSLVRAKDIAWVEERRCLIGRSFLSCGRELQHSVEFLLLFEWWVFVFFVPSRCFPFILVQ